MRVIVYQFTNEDKEELMIGFCKKYRPFSSGKGNEGRGRSFSLMHDQL